MSVTRMTIHRGLSEMKVLTSRISKQIQNFSPVAVKQMGKIVNGNVTVESFNELARAESDSIDGLMKRQLLIKRAVVMSNSQTQVEIGGNKMSVSDAITMKSEIQNYKNLLAMSVARRNAAIAAVNRGNEEAKGRLQNILLASFGKDTTKHDQKVVEATTKQFMELNEYTLVDPLEIDTRILRLEKFIGDFEAEVDAVLSESNSTTFIEVED